VNHQHNLRNYTHHEHLDRKNFKPPDARPEPVPEMVLSFKHSGFKKKSRNNVPSGERDYFKGLTIRLDKDGPKIYEKTIDRLTLYKYTV